MLKESDETSQREVPRDFSDQRAADKLLVQLIDSVNWQQACYYWFGKCFPAPRPSTWFVDYEYRYSGVKHAAALRLTIASVSLMMSHCFLVKNHFCSDARFKMVFNRDSLLIMGGDMQKFWLHGVPKTKQPIG